MLQTLFDSIISGNFDMEFANLWALCLLPLPAFIYFLVPAYKAHSESVQVANLERFTSTKSFAPQKANSIKKWPYALLALIWFGFVLVAARPEQIIVSEQKEVSVRDILLVIDISGSMAIRDMEDENGQTSRMQVMQTAVSQFIEKREHDNIGLVVFGSQALPLSPVSQDHTALLEQLNEMVPGMAGPQTSIGDAIGVAIKTYRQMDKQALDLAKEANIKSKERMMILLTDGLDTSSVLPPRVALRLAQKQNVMIHTIAFGDANAEASDSSIDTKLLKDIAKETKGSYHHASQSLSSLQNVYEAIDKLTPRKVTLVGITEHKPLFMVPLLTSFTLLMVLLGYSINKWRPHD